ncbi:DUF6415 family natural product biosynthesis protein [Streptomyces sp. NPDC046831]|uniref:DUF6415 family natural product biosynthesis protein n=1 Tax=Streptomyces sp. NPDC046831 TaxID=3154805 RepID=UPI0033C9F74F
MGSAVTTRGDAPTNLTAAPIDAGLIRQSYDAVLLTVGQLPEDQRALLAGLLRGHAGLLLPEVEARMPRMRGEWRHTAEHVVRRTHHALKLHERAAPPPPTGSART